MSNVVATAADLRELVADSKADFDASPEELAKDWLRWFDKRGERFLTTAAKFGFTEATLDLPLPLAQTLYRSALRMLLKELRLRVPGCNCCLIEEEYEDQILFKVEISWAALRPKNTQTDSLLPSSAAPSPREPPCQSDTDQYCSRPGTPQTLLARDAQYTASDAPPQSH